jgi:hypothetical protein
MENRIHVVEEMERIVVAEEKPSLDWIPQEMQMGPS